MLRTVTLVIAEMPATRVRIIDEVPPTRVRDSRVVVFQTQRRRHTGVVAVNHVGRRGITVVGLRFYESVIDKQVRALELALRGTRHVRSERASVYRAEKIARLRITDGGFRNDDRNRAVGVVTAARQGIATFRFRDRVDGGQSGVRESSPLKRRTAARSRRHADIELLGGWVDVFSRERIPRDTPATILRNARQAIDLQLEH